MKLIKKLQECATIGQADPILTKLNAGPAVKKLVETAIILSNSPDQQQRNHAYSFMESAIRELEKDDDDNDDIKEESPMGMHSHEDGLSSPTIGAEGGGGDKVQEEHNDDEHKINEEELSNHNQGARTEGSDQSTDNTQPYKGEGEDTTNGEKPMQDMDGTVNQWNETGGMPPPNGGGGGMPPPPNGGGGMPGMGAMPPNQMAGMPNGGGMIMPGLAPDIAQEMGMGMPAPPPMDTSQMMRQMQYTVKNIIDDYHKKVSSPMNARLNSITKHYKEALTQQNKTISQQREAIKALSAELRETKASAGTLKLDIDHIRNNATATFRETTKGDATAPTFNGKPLSGMQPGPSRLKDQTNLARTQIAEMDKILRTETSPIYQ